MQNDTILQAFLEIKESIGRIEQKVDNMSSFDDRIKSLESSRSMVYGVMWFLGVLWVGLIAWVTGLGDWVYSHFHQLNGKNN